MRRIALSTLVLGLGFAVLAFGGLRGSQAASPTRCPATPVDGDYVRAGPFAGGIARQYDVVDGRFRLRVGGYRDVTTGLTQKIPWSVSRRVRVTRRLRITATRLPPLPPRSFTTTLSRTSALGDRKRWFFSSTIKPPAEGCWRLRFRSGNTTGTLIVLVRD